MSVVIITPTTGDTKLLDAVYSVRDQTYPNIKHLIVVDGKEFKNNIFLDIQFINPNVEIVYLQTNVGKNGFYGHRIYAAFAHLVNETYISFLDQDNWIEKNHISTLVDTIENKKVAWAYSLRNIYDKNDKFLCEDNCESLGKWSVWTDNNSYHLDTSSYLFKKDFLTQVASLWHFGYGGDRRFFNIIKDLAPYATSGKYTLNYRLDGNPTSASPNFFTYGNEIMSKKYNNNFPWTSLQ
jgi:GT2 family glycosyltransferase